jgi:hypothetical protein
MGHGSRDVHGYSRETEDEAYIVKELSKLWNGAKSVTTTDLVERDADLRRTIRAEIDGQIKMAIDDNARAVTAMLEAARKENNDLREQLKKLGQSS